MARSGRAAGRQTIPNSALGQRISAAGITYRAATPDDHAAIAQVWLDSWSSTTVAEELAHSRPTLEALRDRLDQESRTKWSVTVALAGAAIIGFLAVDRGAAILDQLFIAPDAHGKGVGTALLNQAKHMMPAGFTLRTAAENSATGFYDRAGLQRIKMMVHPAMGHRLVQYRWAGAAVKP